VQKKVQLLAVVLRNGLVISPPQSRQIGPCKILFILGRSSAGIRLCKSRIVTLLVNNKALAQAKVL
jgi:hypothetical protein